jgi:hypothetical protein
LAADIEQAYESCVYDCSDEEYHRLLCQLDNTEFYDMLTTKLAELMRWHRSSFEVAIDYNNYNGLLIMIQLGQFPRTAFWHLLSATSLKSEQVIQVLAALYQSQDQDQSRCVNLSYTYQSHNSNWPSTSPSVLHKMIEELYPYKDTNDFQIDSSRVNLVIGVIRCMKQYDMPEIDRLLSTPSIGGPRSVKQLPYMHAGNVGAPNELVKLLQPVKLTKLEMLVVFVLPVSDMVMVVLEYLGYDQPCRVIQ